MRRTIITLLAVAAMSIPLSACAARPESSNTAAASGTAEPAARGTPTPSTTGSSTTGSSTKPSTKPSSSTPSDEGSECAETQTWDTAGKTAAPYSTDALYLARVGRHACYDRLVLDVNGAADVGYAVRYVPVVTVDGSGKPLPVAGKAALQVVVHAPPLGLDDSGHQPGRLFANTGDYLYTADQLAQWRSLRAVRFAGFFEGQSTLAVGVREKLPFRVSSQLDSANQVRHLVIDIAHTP
jgi:hypothetical protein